MSRHDYREPASPIKWAQCCGRTYHGSLNRAHWVTCLECKQPLTYGDAIPDAAPALSPGLSTLSSQLSASSAP